MPDLSSNNRKLLLELARNAIKTYLETGDHLRYETPIAELKISRGCFITLRIHKELRGCVGTFETHKPLCDNVIRMSIAAAFQDPRFKALTKSELNQVKIEISVLGELEKIDSVDLIEIGRHGVYIKLGNRSGTFLPDVAVEQKWSAPEFVIFCAREKAGLSPEECARAEIYRYEVEKFKE